MLLQFEKKYVLITKNFSIEDKTLEQNIDKNEQQPQEATTVGMFLRFTRQNQKKSVETVAKALCIRKIYIKAIEESDFKELPPVPYGIGFVRSYADYLGLNADRIVQCYKEEAMPKKSEQGTKQIVKKHTSITIPNKKQILIGIALVLGIYFITLSFNYDKDTQQKIIAISDIESPKEDPASFEEVANIIEEVTEEPTTLNVPKENFEEPILNEEQNGEQNEEQNEEQKKEQNEVSDKEQKNIVTVKFKGESWFEVKDETTVYISGIYKEGFEYTLPDVPNLIFSVGRYFNVDVFINGKLVKVAGPKKQTNIQIDEFLNH